MENRQAPLSHFRDFSFAETKIDPPSRGLGVGCRFTILEEGPAGLDILASNLSKESLTSWGIFLQKTLALERKGDPQEFVETGCFSMFGQGWANSSLGISL